MSGVRVSPPVLIKRKMKVVNYIVDSFNEVSKNVTWPTVKELQSSTTLVLVASAIFAVCVALMDTGFKKLLEFVY